MTKTVLEIAQDAAFVIGIDDIVAIVGSNQPASRAMRVHIDQSGINLTRMRNTWGASWTILTVEYPFTTIAGQAEYPLPEDFESLIDGTLWDRSEYHEGRGALSPQEWQQLKSGLVQDTVLTPYYRIKRSVAGNTRALVLHPTPSAQEELVFEYTSKNWLTGSDGSTRDKIEEDTDIPLFDYDLIRMDILWRFKQSRGLTFAAELAEFEQEVRRRFAEDAGSRAIEVGRVQGRARYPQTPETGYGGIGV